MARKPAFTLSRAYWMVRRRNVGDDVRLRAFNLATGALRRTSALRNHSASRIVRTLDSAGWVPPIERWIDLVEAIGSTLDSSHPRPSRNLKGLALLEEMLRYRTLTEDHLLWLWQPIRGMESRVEVLVRHRAAGVCLHRAIARDLSRGPPSRRLPLALVRHPTAHLDETVRAHLEATQIPGVIVGLIRDASHTDAARLLATLADIDPARAAQVLQSVSSSRSWPTTVLAGPLSASDPAVREAAALALGRLRGP